MPIKWTEKDALKALQTLTNPFELVSQALAGKPKLPSAQEITARLAQNRNSQIAS